MSDRIRIDLFAEDRAHEAFVRPLVERICRGTGIQFQISVRSALGGRGRAISELDQYQRVVESGFAGVRAPDILAICIDANCRSFVEARNEVEKAIHTDVFPNVAIACPDPHIERWYLSDPQAFARVVGRSPSVGQKKCGRDYYKQILLREIQKGGHPTSLGGTEFAPEIVAEMDLFQVGKADSAFKHFIDDVRRALTRLT